MKSFLQFLKRAYQYFRRTKRVWRKPPRAALLIIDRGTASPLDEMFAHHKPHVLDIRGESINMRALLRAVPKIRLGALAYIEAYIDFVKPKLILSRTDNNATMWQLKRRKNAPYQVALVQNGARAISFFLVPSVSDSLNIESKSVNLVDKYFVFGECVGKILGTRVKAKFEYSGSLVLNNLDFRRDREKTSIKRESFSDVALISTFRSKETKLNESHKVIYRSLDDFLSKTNYRLLIIGNGISTIEKELELKFLSSVFLKCDFHLEFFRMGGESYRHLESNKWIVTGQSTLGYESLVASAPVGFLHPNSAIYDGRDFDATSNLGSSGLFWSRSDDPQEHNRIFTYLDSVSDEQWERDSGSIRDQLMAYDYGNTKIRAYVEGVLADSLESN